MKIITIGREFGSGGREFGKRISANREYGGMGNKRFNAIHIKFCRELV